MNKNLYYDLNFYLKNKYGQKTKKITIDAGFTCPNRLDGKKGCIYCLNGSNYFPTKDSIESQIQKKINFYSNKKINSFIAYFQAYTNTFASPQKLKQIYSTVNKFPKINVVAIGTRPDCIDKHKLDAIKQAIINKDIWIEYGLQSIDERTLQFIQRGHTVEDFKKAVLITKEYPDIAIGTHIILGFEWETKEYIEKLAVFLNKSGINYLKIHLLHILKGTELEKLYIQNKIKLPSMEKYISMVVFLLERLNKKIIIHRLTGEGTKENHIAPIWALQKSKILNEINKKLLLSNSFQGKFAKE